MNRPTQITPHPDPEVLAAFVEGNVAEHETAGLTDHLRSCAECRLIVGETARWAREEAPADEKRQPVRSFPKRWWLLTAAAATVIAGGVLWQSGERSGVDRLVAAAPRDVRFVEPRISGGFPWAPTEDIQRSAENRDPRHMELVGAAGVVLKETATDASARGRQAAGVAHLIAGAPDAAVAELTKASQQSQDATVWSDLAAAHYVAALRTDSPEKLSDALSAVDEALRLEPGLREALFNRALILQRLHLRDAALEAWRRYLEVDDRSEWAGEARRNMETLTSQQPPIRDEMEGHYSQLEAGDVAVADAFAERDAGEVRRFFQHEVMGRWGDAVLAGRESDASRHLTAARTLANAVSRSTQEVSLQNTVVAIESGSHERREQLARAHVAFRDGRRTYRERKPAASEPLLASAAADFTRGGSPMAHDANVYRAVAVFGQSRIAEAEVMFRRLTHEIPGDQPALRAYLDWQIASCHMTRADWGTSIELLSGVITTLDRLGETNNAAYVRDILSQVYDITGDRRRAWQHRIAALRELGKSVSYRLQHLISGLGYDASQRKDWRAATSFLQLEIALAHTVGDKELQTDALLRRALVRARLNDDDNAVRDLRAAKQVIDSVEDAALQESLRADEIAAAALIASSPS
ncbi:MAG TPA: hypothetical protein VF701_02875, partial [Thermoanaerobaculia bacterium]